MQSVPEWKTNRKILGMSAILLPLRSGSEVDWQGFENHVIRTLDAGLVPAVNMDTGFANLIDESTRLDVLRRTQVLCGEKQFVAGAFVGDEKGSTFNPDAYSQQIASIAEHSGTPVIFQSFGLTGLPDKDLIGAYEGFGRQVDEYIAFELGTMFAPFGKIYSLEVYRELLGIAACTGAKHSSLSRELEWERLAIRDDVRPGFHVLTGNDLAIDMVMYGSDYLLGLSTMAPDLFSIRDSMWQRGDKGFFQLNDILQYLGFFAFRKPVPAYKHSASQFLKLRGWIENDSTHPGSPERPGSDVEILASLLYQLDGYVV